MFKKILIIIFFIILPNVSFSGTFFNLSKTQSVTGTIKTIEGNYLYLIDEPDRFVRRFIYDGRGNIFKPGDRVRIHYPVFRNVIELIKLMTPLEYKKNGQNLGFIKKTEASQ